METFDAGSLGVKARWRAGELAGLAVALRRPPVAGLLSGRSPAQALAIIPRLYSLCAAAQQAAAAAALAAATGASAPPVDHRGLWIECLHEHLWRLLLDWPQALGLPGEPAAFAAWRRARGDDGVFAASEAAVAAALQGVVARGRERRGAAGVEPAPERMAAADCLAALRSGEAMPEIDDLPATVATAHAQRVAAMVAALAGLRGGQPCPPAAAGASGWGVGQVLTARGVLTHAALVVDGVIADYRIWAPTDRRFATAAPLARLVAGRRWPDAGAARQGLEQAVLALDPCLPYSLEIADA
ncbi:MAG: hypothetical protein FIB06_12200 [Betaproteobacteria bacterium]|nr:hypothetical protein [Betaproteobacteria bacterium]